MRTLIRIWTSSLRLNEIEATFPEKQAIRRATGEPSIETNVIIS